MGETIIEKIIRHNTGKAVKPGDIVTVNVDRCMIHDIFIPFVADKFEEMGFTKLHDPDKVVLIYDHLVPASQQDDTRHFHKGDEFVEKYNSANEKTKVGLNIQKVFDAINNEDYEYVYNKLDNTFKQTNFKTVQEFKNYIIQNFSGKQLKYGECQQQGSLYIFNITITEGTKQTNKRVIMQLKDGTDFVMSFNVN